VEEQLSMYYLTLEVTQVTKGILIAVPPKQWGIFRTMTVQELPYHSHSLGLIELFLKLVLRAKTGFRGAAVAVQSVSALFPTDEGAPSANGGQMWLLRLEL